MSRWLAGYDYSQAGCYFVTICTQHHRLVFGSIVNDQVDLKGPGQIAQSVWVTLPSRFAHVKLDTFVSRPTAIGVGFGQGDVLSQGGGSSWGDGSL